MSPSLRLILLIAAFGCLFTPHRGFSGGSLPLQLWVPSQGWSATCRLVQNPSNTSLSQKIGATIIECI